MSDDLSEPPIYDTVVEEIKDRKGFWLTEAWRPWIISIKDFLNTYISSAGFNVPQMTYEERQLLMNVPDGRLVFITTQASLPVNQLQIFVQGSWYTFTLTLVP